jgi:hypothetical protein
MSRRHVVGQVAYHGVDVQINDAPARSLIGQNAGEVTSVLFIPSGLSVGYA